MEKSEHLALQREVQEALNEAAIYAIGSYGWVSENDPDPEFIGHAMWQVDAPPLDQSALFGEGPVRRRPKDIEKEILICGEDFCGLMEMSRLSIGLSLVWKSQAQQNPIDESNFFWLHHTDSFLKLAMASDRLRDLLIIACAGTTAKRYGKMQKGKSPQTYVTPFEASGGLISKRGIHEPNLAKPVSELPAVARELAKFRIRRNAIVHDVATRMAKFVGETATVLQKRFDQEQKKPFLPNSRNGSELLLRSKTRRTEIELEIEHATEDLKTWYTLLIEASNYVFQVEYWTRRHDAMRQIV